VVVTKKTIKKPPAKVVRGGQIRALIGNFERGNRGRNSRLAVRTSGQRLINRGVLRKDRKVKKPLFILDNISTTHGLT
jgi:hypothetical protein